VLLVEALHAAVQRVAAVVLRKLVALAVELELAVADAVRDAADNAAKV